MGNPLDGFGRGSINFDGNASPTGESAAGRVSPGKMRDDPRFQRLMELSGRGAGAQFRRGGTAFSSRITGRDNEMQTLTRQLADEYGTDYVSIQQAARTGRDIEQFAQDAEALAERLTQPVGKALSFVGNTTEGIQAAQQVTFRVAKGALDPDTTILGEVRNMQLGRYFDGNELLPVGIGGRGAQHPDEIVEFGQLMRLGAGRLGVEEEVPEWVYRWGGTAGDLFVDPLVFGGSLRAIGKVTKSGGLERLGSAMAAPIAEAAKGSRHLMHLAAPGAVERAESATLKWLDGIMSIQVPSTRGRKVSLGEVFSVDGRNPLRSAADEGGELTIDPRTRQRQAGREGEVVDAERRARRTARLTMEAVEDRVESLQGILGRTRFRSWIQSSFEAISRRAYTPIKSLQDLPEGMRETVANLVTETVDNRGILLDPEALSGLASVRTEARLGSVGPSFADELAEAAKARGAVTREPTRQQAKQMIRPKQVPVDPKDKSKGTRFESPDEAFQRTVKEVREQDPAGAGQLLMRTNVERVRHLASQHGTDPDFAENLFRQAVSKTTEADAILGFRASLYEPIREAVFERVLTSGLDAQGAGDLWRRGMQAVMNGERDLASVDVTDLVEASLTRIGKLPKQGGKLKTKYTFGEVVGDVAGAAQLGLADYFRGLVGGHLRKVYGQLVSDDTAQALEKSFEARELLPSRWITDDVLKEMSESFPGETKELQRYLKQVSPTLASERGLILRQDRILSALQKQGVSQARADEFMTEFLSRMNPGMEAFLRDVRNLRMKQQGRDMPSDLDGTLRKSFTADRKVESGGFMEMLAELSGAPDVALIEGMENIGKSLPASQLMADLFKLASKNPRAMQDDLKEVYNRFPREHRAKKWEEIDPSKTEYGPFAGKTVHRYLARELNNLLADTKYRATHYQRARSLVQAGLIAKPSATAANLAGGFLSAAQLGLNPFKLAVHMSKAARELWENKGRIADEDAIGDLLTTGLRENDLLLFSDNYARASLGLEEQGLTKNLMNTYARLLETPLGRTRGETTAQRAYNAVSGGLGLRGFEFVEDLFKIGAYRLAREEGLDPKAARRMARFAVFDYGAQPEALRWVRDTGLMPFASFPVFAAARTVNAVVNRPGVVAVADRLPDVLFNALEPNQEVRDALVASMEPWQEEGGWVPLWRDGNDYFGIPMRQLVPTSGFGRSLADNLGGLGLLGPLVDVVTAAGGTGESKFGARYGKRVFSSDADAPTAIRQTAQFLYNSFAPALPRAAFSFPGNPDSGEYGGLVGALMESVRRMPAIEVNGHDLTEIRKRKVDRGPWSAAVAGLVRSPSAISLDPEVASVMKGYENAQAQLRDRLRSLEERRRIALDQANVEQAVRLSLQKARMELEVDAEWVPRILTWSRYLEWARNNGRFPGEREGDTE